MTVPAMRHEMLERVTLMVNVAVDMVAVGMPPTKLPGSDSSWTVMFIVSVLILAPRLSSWSLTLTTAPQLVDYLIESMSPEMKRPPRRASTFPHMHSIADSARSSIVKVNMVSW